MDERINDNTEVVDQNTIDSGFGSEQQYFVEIDLTVKLISSICNAAIISTNENQADVVTWKDECDKILLKYLEQPLLISPHIPRLVGPLNSVLTTEIEKGEIGNVSRIELQSQRFPFKFFLFYLLFRYVE